MPGADQEYRDALERRAEKHGWPALHAELLAIDPDSASRIKPTDSQRIQRALEVFHVSGQTLTSLHATQSSAENGFEFIKIALVPEDRAELHKAIEKRFKQMISKGFLEEVRALVRDNAFVRDAPSMRAVGYRQLLAHLLDGEPLEDAILKGIYATRQLAKRQLTWLRKMPGLQTFDAYAPDIHAKCDSWLENIL
ncbi:MAG: tRNA (adenosine(37)-N6)-dimethylallyltransferase MiaA, partial [Gammaproteobacteria bacterium]|nr:tRNA (adenosine(37)-N6)-dimethylallyltransferase MiaA [Gammaproteobacteria bacterium]